MDSKSLEKGDQVNIEILEKLSDSEWIVSIEGNLLRTKCQLGESPKVGDRIKAKVTTTNPLKFQRISRSEDSLDLKI